jgi:hypothetical protein
MCVIPRIYKYISVYECVCEREREYNVCALRMIHELRGSSDVAPVTPSVAPTSPSPHTHTIMHTRPFWCRAVAKFHSVRTKAIVCVCAFVCDSNSESNRPIIAVK